MPPSTATVPTAAERIRSACIRGRALLAVADGEPVATPICHVMADGSLAMAVPADRLAENPGDLQAMLELIDHAPLRLRERVRTLVWIGGRLQRVPPDDVAGLLDLIAADDPNPALLQVRSPRSVSEADEDEPRYILLRLAMESVVVADATGAESVGVDEVLAAGPDPFCSIEAGWLRHLDCSHPEVVERLATRLPAGLRRGRVRPLSVDRYGMWLRVEGPADDHDARLTFPRPVSDLAGLNRSVRVLMGCPFLNGLRARPA